MHYVSCVSGEGGDSGETAVTSTNSISILYTMLYRHTLSCTGVNNVIPRYVKLIMDGHW